MPFLTVSKGAPATDIEDGVYVLTLTDVTGPRTITAQTGPQAGNDIDLLDWHWATEDGRELESSTSTASGPKSKSYAYLTALFGGKAPPIGLGVEKDHVVGRQVLGTVQADANGWPRITNVSALPSTMPLPTTAPTNTEAVVPAAKKTVAPRPAGAPVVQQGSDLPF